MDNIFTDIIYKKMMTTNMIGKVKNWLRYKKFIKELNKISPDFDMLWQFADFVKTLEITSWYDNSKSNIVFSSKDYSNGENGFIILKENPKTQIILKLQERDRSIKLSIKRDYGHKRNSDISFIDGQVELMQQEDEMLMLNVIREITHTMQLLLKKYYNPKKHHDCKNYLGIGPILKRY